MNVIAYVDMKFFVSLVAKSIAWKTRNSLKAFQLQSAWRIQGMLMLYVFDISLCGSNCFYLTLPILISVKYITSSSFYAYLVSFIGTFSTPVIIKLTSKITMSELRRLPSLRKLLNPAEDPPRKNDITIPAPHFRGQFHSRQQSSTAVVPSSSTRARHGEHTTVKKSNTGSLPSISNLLDISSRPSHSGSSDKHALSHGQSHGYGHESHAQKSSNQRDEYDTLYRQSSNDELRTTQQRRTGYPCERCGRVFGRKADALKHIRVVHDKLKIFSCRVCGKRFARKDYCMVRIPLLLCIRVRSIYAFTLQCWLFFCFLLCLSRLLIKETWKIFAWHWSSSKPIQASWACRELLGITMTTARIHWKHTWGLFL